MNKLHKLEDILEKIEKYTYFVDNTLVELIKPKIHHPELHNVIENILLESKYVRSAIQELKYDD